MRKLTLAAIILFVFIFPAQAQIGKGSLFFGGDIGGSSIKTKTDDVTTRKYSVVTITPAFGIAIKENLIVGVNVLYDLYDNKNLPNNGRTEAKAYGGGFFFRKYKNIGKSGFYIFLHTGVGAIYEKQEQEGPYQPLTVQKETSFFAVANPGISFAVSKKFHIETGFTDVLRLYYVTQKTESGNPASTVKSNSFGISTSLNNAASNLFLGFRLLIGK